MNTMRFSILALLLSFLAASPALAQEDPPEETTNEGDETTPEGEDPLEEPEMPIEEPELDEPDDFDAGPDLGPIRDAFTSLMDELVRVRSRMAVLGRQLFRTRVLVRVQNRAGGDNSLQRIVVKLDGAPIFRGGSDFRGEDGQQVFDGFAAPGPHVVEVEVEQRARADDDYRYTLRESFRITVVRERLTEIDVILDDDSNMGEDFEDDGEGEYDIRTRFRVATRALN